MSHSDEYRLGIPIVRRIAKSLHPRNQSEFDEFVSAGLVGLAMALRTYAPAKGKLATWATMPVRRQIINFIRKNNPNWTRAKTPRRPVSVSSLEEIKEKAGDFLGVEGRFFDDHEVPSEKYLLGLPPKTRKVMRMLYWDGLDASDVCRKLKMTKANVSMHKTNGLRLMRERMAG